MPQIANAHAEDGAAAPATSLFVTAQDGLRLHVRDYGARLARALPIVCLPGLARTAADFESLALALSSAGQRRVFAVDYRGRGKSDYDRNPENYSLHVELADLLAVLTALGIGRAAFVGTSRGGLLTMLLAVARPTAIAGCVLNDIGPVIELVGLMRIKGYVGKLPHAASFREAADRLRQRFGSHFPKWDDADWLAFAHRTFKVEGARIVPDYDPALATVLAGVSTEQPLPPLWREFDALARVPVMVVRGTNSDILSAATVQAMRERRRSGGGGGGGRGARTAPERCRHCRPNRRVCDVLRRRLVTARPNQGRCSRQRKTPAVARRGYRLKSLCDQGTMSRWTRRRTA